MASSSLVHPPAARPRALWLWGPVALLCAAIFVVSSVPDVPDLLPGASSDKLAHGIVYSGLGFLLARALTAARPERLGLRLMASAVLLAGLYGLSDEVHQLFVPGRAFELRDLLADLIGSALGAGAYRLCDIIGRPARGSGLA